MNINRRKFLKAGSSAIALSAGLLAVPDIVKGIGKSDGVSPDAFDRIAELNVIDFQNHIGSEFKLYSNTHGARTVQLIDVADILQKGKETKIYHTQGFSLLFKASRRQSVKQDVYYIEHPELGYFYMLLAPVLYSEKSRVICYEGIVNRFV